MKRLTVILMACLLVLGMSQCKKEKPIDNNEGEKVFITLNVDNGFSKGHVTPGQNTAPVVYDYEDIIMVGYDGAYVGDLTYNGTAFTGSLSISQSGEQPLHFYYLAGVSQDVTNNQCTVDISDQSSRLGIISYGTSNENYSSGTVVYTAYLRNQGGLVNVTLTEGTDATVTVAGMKTTATIDFATPGITPAAATGDITLYSESGTSKWVILLPQNAVDDATVTIGSAGYTVDVPEIKANDYLHGETAIVVNNAAPAAD